jgi:aldehyde dehydrogenase (NAD+)
VARKKTSKSAAVTVAPEKALNGGPVALPPHERTLTFGKKWDYAPAPEANDYVRLKPRYQHFINGKFVAPHSGNFFASINPANEEKLAEIAEGDAYDVDMAVRAARAAYKNVWGKMSGRERGKYLYRIARIIQEKSRELSIIETMDGGKTIKESRDVDLPLVAAHFFYYAGWADKLQYAFPAAPHARSASRAKSFRGIFRC